LTSGTSGLFVCVEGIDGAGKTTAAHTTAAALRRHGVPATVFDKQRTGFGTPYVRRHTGALRELIWGHPPDDPYLELGDMHWVYLQAAWYAAVARCAIAPLLAAGQVVVTDTWTYKFLAKLALRPEVDLDAAAAVFAGLPRPDLVVHLQLDPAVAARRKDRIAISEAGNHEGVVALTAQAFIDYQQRLAVVLDGWSRRDGWTGLDVTALGEPEVADAVTALVIDRLRPAPAVPQPVGTPGRP
jgi:thymidylate kinase